MQLRSTKKKKQKRKAFLNNIDIRYSILNNTNFDGYSIKDLETIPNKILQKTKPLENEGEKLLETLKNDYNLTEIPQEIKASTDNWYMFSSIVVPFLIKKGINKNIL